VSTVKLRKAQPGDQGAIRQLVYGARLDRTALHWSHFVVAEMPEEGIVGIGQIRPYPNCPELGSMVVRKPFREQGIGGMVIRALLADHPPPVYLECRSHMAPYYARFGFREIPWQQAPMPLKLKSGTANVLGRLFGLRISVMRWDGPTGHDDSQGNDSEAVDLSWNQAEATSTLCSAKPISSGTTMASSPQLGQMPSALSKRRPQQFQQI
jgi:amino-acid N-acetyltransferase